MILTAGLTDYEDQRLNDKEIVLCYMNIRSMNFEFTPPENSEMVKFLDYYIEKKPRIKLDSSNQNLPIDLTHMVENRSVNGVPIGSFIPIIADLGVLFYDALTL